MKCIHTFGKCLFQVLRLGVRALVLSVEALRGEGKGASSEY